MSMFSIEPSNLSLSLTLGLTLSLSGCQTLPKQPHLPESQALSARVDALYQQNDEPQDDSIEGNDIQSDSNQNSNNQSSNNQYSSQENSPNTNPKIDNTDLVAAISEQSEIHPDLSGYHPIVTGANAFASRSILTSMATRTIDEQ